MVTAAAASCSAESHVTLRHNPHRFVVVSLGFNGLRFHVAYQATYVPEWERATMACHAAREVDGRRLDGREN